MFAVVPESIILRPTEDLKPVATAAGQSANEPKMYKIAYVRALVQS